MPGTKTISLKIALSGEKEFRAAMQAAKKEAGLLNSELKNLETKFDGNANSMEALRAKQEKLTEAQKTYTKQIDDAREHLAKAEKNEEEQNKRLQELKEKLEAAEKALTDMKDAGLENTEAYAKQEQAVQALADEVTEASVAYRKTEGTVADWKKQLSEAEIALQETNKELTLNEKYLKEAESSADGCATSIDKFGRETTETAGDMDKLRASVDTVIDEVDKVAGEGGLFASFLGSSVVDKLVDVAGDALLDLGRKAVEAAKYVVDVGSSFEAQMSKVSAISGAAGGDLAALTEKAEEMGRTTKFTATEAGEAFEYMAMAGWKTSDMLEGIEGIMNLAAASGEDLGTTSDIVTDALTAFGLKAKDSGHFADILASASSNANTNVSMMGETFKYAAPIAGALGYSAEETAEAIGLMANSGIKASQAGTSLRSIMTNLSRDFTISGDALGEVTIQTTNADGTMRSFTEIIDDTRAAFGKLTEEEKTNTAKTLVGKNAMSGFLALMNAGESDIDKLRTALENCDGAADRMADTMQDNLQGKLTLFNSACEGLGIALYNYFSGPLQGAVELATGFISGLTNLIAPQKTELETFIDDIKKANDETIRAIDTANSNYENAEKEVAQVKASEEILEGILDNAKKVNEIDLGNGRTVILSETGQIIAHGLKPFSTETEKAASNLENLGDIQIDGDRLEGNVSSALGKPKTVLLSYFNEISGKQEVVKGEINEFGNVEIDTSKIAESLTGDSTDAVVKLFDETGEKVGTVRGQISKFGDITIDTTNIAGSLTGAGRTALVSIFNEAGEKVDTVKTTINQFGEVEIDTSKLSEKLTGSGANAVVTILDKTGAKVDEVHGQIDELGKVKLNTDNVTMPIGDAVLALDKYSDATRTSVTSVYQITDEYAKFQTSNIIQNLSGIIPELTDAWDEQSGVLRVNRNEMKQWFNTAEAIMMREALFDRQKEMVKAYTDAMIDQTMAQSAASEAQKEYGEFLAANNLGELTEKQVEQAMNSLGSGGLKDAWLEVKKNVRDANAEVENADTAMGKAKEGMDAYDAALGAIAEEAGMSKEELLGLETATEDTTQATGDLTGVLDEEEEAAYNAAEAVSTLTEKQQEAVERIKDQFHVTDEQLSAIKERLEASGQDYGAWAEEVEGAVQSISTSYEELVAKVKDSSESFANSVTATGETSQETAENYVKALEEQATKLEDWLNNMKTLGQMVKEGSFSQDLYDSFVEAGAGANAALIEGLVQNPELAVNAMVAYNKTVSSDLQSDAETIAGYTTTGQAYADYVTNGTIDTLNMYADRFIEGAGVIPESIAQGAENGSARVEDSVIEILGNANSAGETKAQESDSIGDQMMTSTASGVMQTQKEVEDAGTAAINTAREAMEQMTSDFNTTGQQIPQALRHGIEQANSQDYTSPKSKVESMMQELVDATKRETEFYDSGVNLIQGLLNGINSKANEATLAVNALGVSIQNAFNGTMQIFSPSKVMKKSGGNIVEGVVQGIKDKKQKAVDEAIVFGEEVVKGVNQSIKITSENQGQYLDKIGAALWGSGVNWSKYGGKFINASDFSRNAMASQSDITQWASATVWRNLDTQSGRDDMKKWLKSEFGMSSADMTKAIAAVSKALQASSPSGSHNDMFDSGGGSSSGYSSKVSEAQKSFQEQAEKARASMQIYASRAENLLKVADEKAKLTSDYEKIASSLQKSKIAATDDIASSMLALQSQAATATRYKLMDQLKAEIDTYKSETDSELQSKLKSLESSKSSGTSAAYTSVATTTAKSMDSMSSAIDSTSKNTARIRTITEGMSRTLTTIAKAIEGGMSITLNNSIGNEKIDSHVIRVVRNSINTQTRALAAGKGR